MSDRMRSRSKEFGKLLQGACLVFMCTLSNSAAAERHALLIGVDKVEKVRAIPLLAGTAHDVQLMAELALKWGAPRTRQQILANTVGADSSPTYAAAASSLDRLSRDARSGDEVLLYLSGHGVQQPVADRNQTTEADHYEEVFLLADSTPWTAERWSVGNAMPDSVLRDWITQMADKGVFVWLVVDTCFAAGMTRGESASAKQKIGDWEVTAHKGVLPQWLSIDLAGMSAKAKHSILKGIRVPGLSATPQAVFQTTAAHPNVLAFYAVSEAAEALEVRIKGQNVGMFTHVLHETFSRAARLDGLALKAGISGRSYKELADSVAGAYRRLPPEAPAPIFSGTLWNRPVLPLPTADKN